MEKNKKRTLNELRQVKTYGYTTPSPTKEKDKKDSKKKSKIEKKQYICKMKEENSNWDTNEFQDWVVSHVNLILGGQQLELFIKNNFGYDDLKLFGKLEEAKNLKKVYQSTMIDKALTYKVNFTGTELQWTD